MKHFMYQRTFGTEIYSSSSKTFVLGFIYSRPILVIYRLYHGLGINVRNSFVEVTYLNKWDDVSIFSIKESYKLKTLQTDAVKF